ncbi:MAG: D-aminoacyl-tRNA deacylase [Sandaracinus sp.]
MRAVVQRVASASVVVDDVVVGAIDRGLLVYLGAEKDDAESDLAYVCEKIAGLRIFSGEDGKMSLAVGDVGGAILVVSQFTLFGDVRRGRRPSFDAAASPEIAERLYEEAVRRLRTLAPKVETGRFRAHMLVRSEGDGPVTLLLDSRKRS